MQRWQSFEPLLSRADPDPVELVNSAGRGQFLLVCEHAGTAIPERLVGLGLAPKEMSRHIAYDIGAEGLARDLSMRLDAPLFLQRYSRLVIDCNRPVAATDSIPETSDRTFVPGNRGLNDRDRAQRYAEIHLPFHSRITGFLDELVARRMPIYLIAVHSFTPNLLGGKGRPWELGVLSNRDSRFAESFLASFRRRNPQVIAAHNEPYVVNDETDYTIPVHGEQRHLPHVLIEVRNDMIAEPEGQRVWGELIAEALKDASGPEGVSIDA